MITLALTSRLWRGELLGLEWKRLDFSNGILDVSQSMIHALKGEIIVKSPKTKTSFESSITKFHVKGAKRILRLYIARTK
ncbi:hypothetical protein BK125_26890 [Paenibacillus odorifer]|uniref:Tyr recombinase domain-containing protein n=2 Tax=Paenibacillus odorifer TaxID=189426 RepID=A0ABX3GEF9_9BACL|nr:hypothetical protein BK125_26890 [Paenibacillus odorifer]OMD06278.1 hypothetical protein BSO21_30955 [Paenibacillus odorifer]